MKCRRVNCDCRSRYSRLEVRRVYVAYERHGRAGPDYQPDRGRTLFLKMKWADIASFLMAQAVAAGTYLVIFLLAPAVLGGIAVILLLIGGLLTGDMGGPLFLPGVFILGLFYALCTAALGLVFFAVTGCVQLLRRRVRVSSWTPVALARSSSHYCMVLPPASCCPSRLSDSA